jgi:bacteriocin biosynthesis cyclodehydratase domain-containing protein
MVLKLDPRYPVVWRSPSSLQLGVDPAIVRLDDVTELQERMLAALAVGVSLPGIAMIARGREAERDALMRTISLALLHNEQPVAVSVALSGAGAAVDAIATALAGSGVHVDVAADAPGLADSRPDLAILVHHFVVPPSLHSLWLRRDVPHLPVVFSEGGVTIGPIVEPGSGPCLLCLELHRRDADPAWPAVATQLLGRRATADSPVLVLEAAAIASRMALDRIEGGHGAARSVRIDALTGRRDTVQWQPHPECGCRGIESLLEGASLEVAAAPPSAGRRETGWAGAAPDRSQR